MRSLTSRPIGTEALSGGGRPELVFKGVEQAGPSFEARVFLNNPEADAATPRRPEAGYAGSYYVYGYGPVAPPEIARARAARRPGEPPVAPIETRVRPDEDALRRALEGGSELTVTVVPVPADPGGELPERPFEQVALVARE